MKKLSFLLALVLIFSSIAVVPVFAATDTTVTVVDDYSRSSLNFGASTTGVTGATTTSSPLNPSTNTVYSIDGTVTTETTFSKSQYTYGHNVYSVTQSGGTNYDTFKGNAYNATSVNIYIDEDDTSLIPIAVRYFAGGVGGVFGFTSAEKPSDVKAAYGADSAYSVNLSYITFGIEKGKWHNITITGNPYATDSTKRTYKVYVDGVQVSFYPTNKANASVNSLTPSSTIDTTKPTATNLTISMKKDEVHKAYFDDLTYYTSATTAFTPDTAATIESAVDGVVTVEDTATLDTIKELATGESAVEIYRANSEAQTGYDAVTENFTTNDIVKLVTQKGSYSYYTLNVEAVEEPEIPENPFVIGDLESDLDVSDGSVSASIELTGDKADKDVTLVVCLYKGITLIEMQPDSVSVGDDPKTLSASISVPEGENYTAKAFVWDSLEGMTMLK